MGDGRAAVGRLKAVDTNILARYLMRDDPVQTPLADAVMAQPSFVSDTVLLETAWLLSSRYRVRRADLAASLHDLVCLPAVHVGEREMILWAIDRFAAGADFADMLHLVTSHAADAFVTFDRGIARAAGDAPPMVVEMLA